MPTLEQAAARAVNSWRDDGAGNGTLSHFTDRAAKAAGYSPADVYFRACEMVAHGPNKNGDTK